MNFELAKALPIFFGAELATKCFDLCNHRLILRLERLGDFFLHLLDLASIHQLFVIGFLTVSSAFLAAAGSSMPSDAFTFLNSAFTVRLSLAIQTRDGL